MNNKGIGKYETLTILVLIICLLAGGFYLILNMSKNTKYNSMYQSAIKFVDISSGSDVAFIESNEYYLVQAYDEELLKSMKSPFSAGNCDGNESKIKYDGTAYFVTLKCGDYFLDTMKSTDSNYKIYKASDWTSEKPSGEIQSREAYSCDSCGVEGDYEEKAFIYLYNKNNGTSYNSINGIPDSTISKKTQYRTVELAFEK